MAAAAERYMKATYGFTLLELLCAMTIGLLLVIGSLDLYAGGAKALSAAEESAQLSEQARAALARIENDVQQAGYYALGGQGGDFRLLQAGVVTAPAAALRQTTTPVAAIGTAAQSCGDNFAVDLAVPLQGSDNRYAMGPNAVAACDARSGGARTGTDTLTIRRAATPLTTASAGRLQLLIDRLDSTHRYLLADGVLPSGTTLQPDLLELHDLQVRSYYIANDSDGRAGLPALRVKTLTSVSGAPAFTDTEVMIGIQDLQVEFLVAGGWFGPEALPANASVRAVRISLEARSQVTRVGEPRVVTWSRVVGIRNAHP
jgi:prepilin-type N-terminal cleavage/methylation domain-containing protein